MSEFVVRDVTSTDRTQWAALFARYRDFYRLTPDPQVIEIVWSWLLDDHNPMHGTVADRDGQLIGIAHDRPFARPSTGTTGTWLDDLFVDDDHRHSGVGRALIDDITDRAHAAGHSVVRWITADTNSRARRLYDVLATETSWVVYDRTPQG